MMDRKVRAVKFAMQMNQLDLVKKLDDLSVARTESDTHRDAIASIDGQHSGLMSNLREKMARGDSFNPDFIQWGLQYANALTRQRQAHEQQLRVADDNVQIAYDRLTESNVTRQRLSNKEQEIIETIWLERNLMEQKELAQLRYPPRHGNQGS